MVGFNQYLTSSEKLQLFILNSITMSSLAIVGFLASLFSIMNQFPQAIKVFRTQDTHSLSLVMYCVVVVAITLWLVYGIMLRDAPLIWANALSLVPIIYIFIIKMKNTILGIDKLSI
jgi:MtN3 and saliva related transmembrane protein